MSSRSCRKHIHPFCRSLFFELIDALFVEITRHIPSVQIGHGKAVDGMLSFSGNGFYQVIDGLVKQEIAANMPLDFLFRFSGGDEL